ncbi:MAG: GyrI-like domain-containing protein [Isosphaeraceae bacterium]
MSVPVRLERHPGQPLLVVRLSVGPQDLPRAVPSACGAVWKAVKSHGITGAGRLVAVYLDGAIHLEVGVEVDPPAASQGDLIASTTPSGPVATATHFGPYSQLHQAHDAIHGFCRQNALTLAGPSWEVYGHWQDDWNHDPSKIRTDVYYLLTPDAAAPSLTENAST